MSTMSEDEKHSETTETNLTTAEEKPNGQAESVQIAAAPRSGSLTAGMSLLFSLAACAAVAYLWWQGQQQVIETIEPVDYSAQIRTVEEDLRSQLADSIEALKRQVESDNRAVQQRLGAETASLGDNLNRLQADIRSDRSGLERRMEMAESSVAKLAEMRLDSARSLGLAEAEYLLRLANERLQLFQDPAGALKALKLSAAQLRALDDPVFNSVRQALAVEIQSLVSVNMPDRVEISGRLLALARGAADWQLDSRRSLQAQGANVLEPSPQEEGWWPRLKSVLSSAVTVHRDQQTATVLLTLDEERLLRENLRLQLQVAQLAAVRAEQALYSDAIALVAEWLRDYYDRETAAVGDALAALEELGQVDLDPTLPEINTALRLLRNLQTAYELDAEAVAEPLPTEPESTP
jgi:uroporphyrin-3 C-methyltransferase